MLPPEPLTPAPEAPPVDPFFTLVRGFVRAPAAADFSGLILLVIIVVVSGTGAQGAGALLAAVALRDLVRLAAMKAVDAFDARLLPAGLKTTVKTFLRIPANLPPGTYTLSLRLPDPYAVIAGDPRYAIRMANTNMWDAATGDNVLTRNLKIDASAPGSKDTSATTFVELH